MERFLCNYARIAAAGLIMYSKVFQGKQATCVHEFLVLCVYDDIGEVIMHRYSFMCLTNWQIFMKLVMNIAPIETTQTVHFSNSFLLYQNGSLMNN
jgi:hypothetical protein